MSLPDYSPETNNILALLNVPVSTSQLPSADPEPSLDTASSRPMNFSSAFSQNSRPKRNAAIAASQNLALQAQTAQHYNDNNNTFDDYSFLSNGGAEAGPGPNSIAAAVARNGIQGDYNVNDPYRLPEPPGANDEMYAALLRSGASNLDELVEQERGGGRGGKRKKGKKGEEGEVEPVKRGRGRPRKDGKPVGTPRTPPPPKKRGRPPRKETTQPRNTTTKGKRKMTEEGDALELPTPPAQYQSLSGGGGGGESYFPDLGAVPQLSPSDQDSDSETGSSVSGGSQSGGGSERGEKEEKRKRKKKRNKKGDPPLIPRIFRQARLIREDEPLLDLEVHESEDKDVEEVEELTEEHKDEIRRAMNPLSLLSFSLSLSFLFTDSPRMIDSAFATKLLEALEEHSEYYDRAYRALHEELLATQIEESLLQHVKEVVLVGRHSLHGAHQSLTCDDLPTHRNEGRGFEANKQGGK